MQLLGLILMKKILQYLLLADLIWIFATGLLTPIYAIFVVHLQGTIIDAGIAWGIMAFAYASLEFPMGFLADKFSRKKFLFISLLADAVIFFFLMGITQIWQLFVLELFLGFSNALGTPAFDGLFSKNLELGKESQGWGMWGMIHGWGIAASAVIGAVIADMLGFPFLFGLISIGCFISALIVLLFIKEGHFREVVYYNSFKRFFFTKQRNRLG